MGFARPKEIIEQLHIVPGMEIADFGVGAGYYVVEFAELVGESGTIYAIDIQQELLTKARSLDNHKHENIEFLVGDIEEKGGSHLADGSVDLVLLSNVLFQLDDKQAAIKEAHRVLRPAGRLAVIDWSGSFEGLGPQPEYVVSESQTRSMGESIGFTYEKALDAGDHHYGMILKK